MKVVILSGSEVPIRLYLTKALATPGLCYCEYLKVTSDQHPQRRNVSIDTFHGSAVLHKDSNMCVCVRVCACTCIRAKLSCDDISSGHNTIFDETILL